MHKSISEATQFWVGLLEKALENITISSALEKSSMPFEGCTRTKRVFLVGDTLREDTDIWDRFIRDTGVEELVLPGTLREIPQKCLRTARLSERYGWQKTVWQTWRCTPSE